MLSLNFQPSPSELAVSTGARTQTAAIHGTNARQPVGISFSAIFDRALSMDGTNTVSYSERTPAPASENREPFRAASGSRELSERTAHAAAEERPKAEAAPDAAGNAIPEEEPAPKDTTALFLERDAALMQRLAPEAENAPALMAAGPSLGEAPDTLIALQTAAAPLEGLAEEPLQGAVALESLADEAPLAALPDFGEAGDGDGVVLEKTPLSLEDVLKETLSKKEPREDEGGFPGKEAADAVLARISGGLVPAENLAALPEQNLRVSFEEAPAGEETLDGAERAKGAGRKKTGKNLFDAIEVKDERTFARETAEGAANAKTVSVTGFDGRDTAEMQLSLGQHEQTQAFVQDHPDGAYTGTVEAGLTRTDFAAMLSDEISSNAGEFVKAGSLVLKDGGRGTINLVLHPEELGAVKIRLELSDNQITGKIVVATKEAYDAFKQSMGDLKQAFVASGFDTNGFDLAWTGAGNGAGQGNQENQNRFFENNGMMALSKGSDTYLDNMPEVAVADGGWTEGNINLVA